MRSVSSACSSGSGTESSVRKCPNSDSSSSPTGFSSEIGVCALRRICSTSSGCRSSSTPISIALGLAAELRAQRPLGADDLVQLLDHVHRHPDRARLVGERAGDRLADPPRRVGRELEALAVVELLRRADEADRPLLDQVEEGQALVAVALRDRDDEAQVRLDHRLLRRVLAALDPLRELDLLRRGQERHLADVLEEELQRVGRDLARRPRRLGLGLVALDDLDLELVERRVELVQLRRVEVELVERARDVLGDQLARLPAALEQRLRLARSPGRRIPALAVLVVPPALTSAPPPIALTVVATLPIRNTLLTKSSNTCQRRAPQRHRPFGLSCAQPVPAWRDSSR